MDHDKKGVLNRAVFDASARQQSTSVARRVEQLDGALQRDERQNDPQNAHESFDWLRSSRFRAT
jgi:hypothetical protein